MVKNHEARKNSMILKNNMEMDNSDKAPEWTTTTQTLWVARTGKECNIKAGETMDLKIGWDFTKEKGRAWEAIQRYQPQLIIGSPPPPPPCTAFSSLQKMSEAKWRGNATQEKMRRSAWKEAVEHMEFCVMEKRRRFLNEHLLGATSKGFPALQPLTQDSGFIQIKPDMCRFGMTREELGGAMTVVKKPTRFVTTSWGIADELGRRHEGGHVHRHLVAGRAT